MKTALGSLLACTVMLGVASVEAQTVKTLNALTSFGSFGNGRIEPPSFDPELDSGNNQRGMAVDPVSGHVVLVNTKSGSGGSSDIRGDILVLDGNTGLTTARLSTNGMAGGNYASSAVAVADDGAVYVCNQVTSSTANAFKIYRWSSVTSANDPTVAFSATISPAQRYGATIDARGSGTGTQLIIGSTGSGQTGTNVVIFTTSDGINFNANVLACPDVLAANSHDGVAFGSSDTFWMKKIGAPLRKMSFDLGTLTATTLASYDTFSLPGSANLGPIAVDTANNLLAAIEVNGGAAEKVLFYDISNSANPPSLLDIEEFTPNNANASAPPGFVSFGTGKLYAHVVNNGLAAFTIDSEAPAAPIIISHPSPATARLASGQSFTRSVVAYPGVTYQWEKDTVAIPNATNASFTIPSVQPGDAGVYRVTVSNDGGNATSSDVVLQVVNLADLYHFNTLWSAAPGAQPYVTSTGGSGTPNERSIAYNVLSNQVYVVQKSGNNYTIHVIDGNTGEKLYNLNTNGLVHTVSEVGGSNPLNLCAIAVAEDGAIYACNETPNAGGGTTSFSTNKMFRVYRWANSDSNTLPTIIFEGDPLAQSSNFRWGDVLNIRGSGVNTQIVLDNHNPATSARFVAVLTPTDETMTTWISRGYFQDSATPFGSSIGRSIEFGPDNTIYQKRRNAALIKSSFDPDFYPGIAGVEAIYTNFPSTAGGAFINHSANAAAVLTLQANAVTTPDSVDLYDVSDLMAPLKIASYNFPQNHVNNQNFICSGVWSGNRLYALAGNNGILALELVSGPPAPPGFVVQPKDTTIVEGGSGSLSVTLDQTASVQWKKDDLNLPGATNVTLLINNAAASDAGMYHVVASNSFGLSTSTVATVTIVPSNSVYRLSEIWSQAVNTQPYLAFGGAGTPFQRCIAYNSSSNVLYVLDRGAVLSINALDPATGTKLYELNVNGIAPAAVDNLLLAMMGIADDGAIYAGNVSLANATSPNTALFRLYRWADGDPNTEPVLVYEGEPADSLLALRWGDAMDVRGSGVNTEVIIDQQRATLSAASILVPTDASMTSFISRPFTRNYTGVLIGRSLQFGEGNTVWQKSYSGPLQLSQFDTNSGTSVLLTNHTGFPNTLGGVTLDTTRNLAIGVNFIGSASTPDALSLFDIEDFANPLLISNYNFPTNQHANNNHISSQIFVGNRVFALNANNGLVAFDLIAPGGSIAPTIQITRNGADVTLSWTDSSAVLQSSSSLSVPDWVDISTVGQTSITENAASGIKFYRLRK